MHTLCVILSWFCCGGQTRLASLPKQIKIRQGLEHLKGYLSEHYHIVPVVGVQIISAAFLIAKDYIMISKAGCHYQTKCIRSICTQASLLPPTLQSHGVKLICYYVLLLLLLLLLLL